VDGLVIGPVCPEMCLTGSKSTGYRSSYDVQFATCWWYEIPITEPPYKYRHECREVLMRVTLSPEDVTEFEVVLGIEARFVTEFPQAMNPQLVLEQSVAR